MRSERSLLGRHPASYVDLVGDLRARPVGPGQVLAADAAGPDADAVEQPDAPLERLTGDRRLEDERGAGPLGGEQARLVDADVVAVPVAAVGVGDGHRVGVL